MNKQIIEIKHDSEEIHLAMNYQLTGYSTTGDETYEYKDFYIYARVHIDTDDAFAINEDGSLLPGLSERASINERMPSVI